MKRKQSGFTLIEIAIVLVIIGLLLGGVLKGQELINSAKVKNMATDFKNIPIYVYGYQDKYKALPGDDIHADTHVSGTVASTNGTPGNGVIDGMWCGGSTCSGAVTLNPGDETTLFWQHIRLAGLAAGTTTVSDASYWPQNAVGGKIGITNSSTANDPITGMKGTYIVCSDGIAGKFAKQLDTTLDDGNTATGSMQVTAAGTNKGGTPIPTTGTSGIVDDTTYLVCMSH